MIRFNRRHEQWSKEMTAKGREIDDQAMNLIREREFTDRIKQESKQTKNGDTAINGENRDKAA